MSFIDDIANVTVTAETSAPSRAGFGVPLFAVCEVPWTTPERVRAYTSLAAMRADGWRLGSPGYRMAAAVVSQTPRRVTRWKIGRRASAYTQTFSLTPATPQAGEVFTVEIDGLAASFPIAGTLTVAAACTGIAAAINALGDVDAVVTSRATSTSAQVLTGSALNGAVGRAIMSVPRFITLTLSSHADWDATTAAVEGIDENGEAYSENLSIPDGGNTTLTTTKRFKRVTQVTIPIQGGTGGSFQVGTRAPVTADGTSGTEVVCEAEEGELVSVEITAGRLTYHDDTVDPGLEADLDAIKAADNDWYGLALDSFDADTLGTAIPWVEANKKLFVWQTADSDAADASASDDVFSMAMDEGFTRSPGFYYPAVATSDGWLAAGLLGQRLAVDPGSDTWAFKTVTGVRALTISDTAHGAVLAKNGNTYEVVNAKAITFEGKTPSGEWVDIVRGSDWLRARLQENVFALFAASERVPYSANGLDRVRAKIDAVLKEAVRVGFLDGDVAPTINVPTIDSLSSEQRATRRLPGVTFSAKVNGAIHAATINGSVYA